MTKSKSNWGKGIAFLYGGFVLFMLSIVIFVSFQDYQLVEDDYYSKETKYQDEIDKQNNLAILDETVRINVYSDSGFMYMKLPIGLERAGLTGHVYFYRPSEKSLDFSIPLEVDSTNQMEIDIKEIAKGLWTVKIDWTTIVNDSSKKYYYEEKIFIN